ncbi:unnamed protein product [Chironomus riparius]|uniref:Ubiquitin-like protease family profile domain-containing protein n=1 Tax=Chironomus riparius TaxID=315576 RepID=A0A9N9RRW8_9DIPT|nr:unnamed protein product [Chironomus riparius]
MIRNMYDNEEYKKVIIKSGKMYNKIGNISERFHDNQKLYVLINSLEQGPFVTIANKVDLNTSFHIKDFLNMYGIKNEGNVVLSKVISGGRYDYVVDFAPDVIAVKEEIKVKDIQGSMIDMTSEGFVKRQKADVTDRYNINDTVVARYKNFKLTHFDYTQLGPNKWMTAISVDVALSYFLKSYFLDEKYRESIHLFTTEMYNNHNRLYELYGLNAVPHDDFLTVLNNHTKGISILDKKNIFIPINQRSHYQLIHATFPEANIVHLAYIDPLFHEPPKNALEVMKLFFNRQNELREKPLQNLKFILEVIEVPPQTDGDCGPFMLGFFKQLLIHKQIKSFTGKDALELRKTVAGIVVNHAVKNAQFPDIFYT